ncbi:DUF5115 domain-containing protein [Prevotella copri]|uniref:DUF5115 domain-containing protein n=1 Tax=Segatella copri TaxID=165179 RepID=A0AAW5I3E3_9BACT|nr:DUF5115 domain-containing protein [Segatella copri]MCF0066922.1 DUF5115 domain-containing protein [Segatella copri]MCP9501113.1 DUF5115 domain-containing protein [Segatella copri]MCP9503893.1 DUF5115 domain-containing protein [Segatella copri]MCP9506859.1 DUF5115 domain-containing protein [Segatella copri]MCP9509945.1 DUF5115 domain-containing protein [Segatella copri]
MKKLSLYISIALAGLFMGSCSEDFKDWADPQTNPQEDAITIPGFTATAAQAIDFASVTTDSVNTFSLSSAALPEGFTLGNARIELTPQGVENATKTTVNTSLDGKGAVADLASVVESAYGKRPTARTFDAQVYVNAIKEGQAVLIDAGKINLVMTPKAPFIDAAYYLVGDMFTTDDVNGWNTISDKQKFKHSDKDVYEDPIFTITFETTKADQYWKIIPKANVDAGNTDASAAGVVGPKVDGEDSMTGSLTNSDAKAGKIAKAGKYKLTLDMMDYSYTIEEVNYDPFIYFIGSTDGWKSSDQKLALVDEAKGVYTGYVYVADPNEAGLQFKFQRVAGSWDNEINAGTFNTFSDAATPNENGNIGVNAGEGVYYFDVNLGEGTIKATKVKTMGIIGQFNGWSSDAVMTWNAEEYCFEATKVGVTADGWKFRVNGGWDINLGGSLNNLTAGGDNITVAGNTVKLYPTRKTNDKIYCTVE